MPMKYIDSEFYIIRGDMGFWMVDADHPYERRHGKENISLDCGNPMNALRFDWKHEATRFVDANWKEVGEIRRPFIDKVTVKVEVERVS